MLKGIQTASLSDPVHFSCRLLIAKHLIVCTDKPVGSVVLKVGLKVTYHHVSLTNHTL